MSSQCSFCTLWLVIMSGHLSHYAKLLQSTSNLSNRLGLRIAAQIWHLQLGLSGLQHQTMWDALCKSFARFARLLPKNARFRGFRPLLHWAKWGTFWPLKTSNFGQWLFGTKVKIVAPVWGRHPQSGWQGDFCHMAWNCRKRSNLASPSNVERGAISFLAGLRPPRLSWDQCPFSRKRPKSEVYEAPALLHLEIAYGARVTLTVDFLFWQFLRFLSLLMLCNYCAPRAIVWHTDSFRGKVLISDISAVDKLYSEQHCLLFHGSKMSRSQVYERIYGASRPPRLRGGRCQI